jgi:hypothetical protein
VPGHIFDTNTIRNFVLTDSEYLLPKVCPGQLYGSSVVIDELKRGARAFEKQCRVELDAGDTRRHRQFTAFNQMATRLKGIGLIEVAVTTASKHADMMRFFACLLDSSKEDMDAGEAESFALAAYRGFDFYTDDRYAMLTIEKYSTTPNLLKCPPPGEDPPPHQKILVHSTTWLLLKAIRESHISEMKAERIFDDMRSVWGHHPQRTLAEMQRKPDLYW